VAFDGRSRFRGERRELGYRWPERWIRASGTLVASPCALLPESAEQEIDLGSTVAWGLERPGSVTPSVPVYIKLDRCPGEYQFMRDRQMMRGATMLTDSLR
jgi:hypothetical protein